MDAENSHLRGECGCQCHEGQEDRLLQIKARWFTDALHRSEYWADQASRDVPWLVSEVERLRLSAHMLKLRAEQAERREAAIRSETGWGQP
jgi:hypothetical protein